MPPPLQSFDWMFLMKILWQASHSHPVSIKTSFCCGSFGSHASKYIHFHRKCFVLEVQCFLGLLCSHSAQVGFLSDVHWITANPPHPCISPIMENTNKTRIPLLQPSVDLSWDPHRKKSKTKAWFIIRWKRSVWESALSPQSLYFLQANKQAEPNRETCNKSGIVWEGYDRCL